MRAVAAGTQMEITPSAAAGTQSDLQSPPELETERAWLPQSRPSRLQRSAQLPGLRVVLSDGLSRASGPFCFAARLNKVRGDVDTDDPAGELVGQIAAAQLAAASRPPSRRPHIRVPFKRSPTTSDAPNVKVETARFVLFFC